MAEVVSDLLFAGKSLREVAGYDDVILSQVVFRRRDKYGRLVRAGGEEELPPGVEVDDNGQRIVTRPAPFQAMFWQLQKRRGLDKKRIEESWKEYLKANPRLGRGGPQ